MFALVALTPAAAAQSLRDLAAGLTADQLQQLQQLEQSKGSATTPPPVTSQTTIIEPAAPNAKLGTSELERVLSSRAGMQLFQYGYDQLGVGRSLTQPQMGSIQDDYVLGPGDQLVITLRGQENSEYRPYIDRDGRVVMPKLNPITAAGLSLGEVRKTIVRAVRGAYVATEAYVTIGFMRQISVLVSGEVNNPGVRVLTGLTTAADAILVSGGVKKTGSLRAVKVQRGAEEFTVDLYSILIGRVHSRNIVLAEGDKIIVPPIGATIAVAGQMRRAGIYELAPHQTMTNVRDALAMASGTTVPGVYRVSLLRLLADGKRQLVDVTSATNAAVRDGEILFVQSAVDVSLNQVTLMGAVRAPGPVALGKYKTVHDLLPSIDVLSPGAYLLFGIVERTDPATLQRTVIPFSPLAVIQGKADFALMTDDTVHILTKMGMRDLLDMVTSAKLGDAAAKKEGGPESQGAPGQKAPPQSDIAEALGRGPAARAFAAGPGSLAQLGQTDSGAKVVGMESVPVGPPPAFDGAAPPAIAPAGEPGVGGFSSAQVSTFGKTIADYRVSIYGAVHDPGFYLVIPGASIADLLVAAQGLADDVDLSNFELTSTSIDNNSGLSTTERKTYAATKEIFAGIGLRPFDRLIFHSVYSDRDGGSVSVNGEVRHPGSFDIMRGEKLSSVLRRAGGFTELAYPEGAVFQRSSIAKAEKEESNRIMTDMRSQLLNYLMKPRNGSAQGPSGDTIAAIQALLVEVSATPFLGRVPVVASLQMIEKHPELDIVLEPGDSIVVPRHPATVLVMGDVVRGGAQRFDSSQTVDDYVDGAGGATASADTSRIIVVLPDGSVRSNGNSWLNFGFDARIPPGSTIYVPRKLEVYDFHQLLTDSIQIFSQLATTAAALAVLSKQ